MALSLPKSTVIDEPLPKLDHLVLRFASIALVGGLPVWLPLAVTPEIARILQFAADAVCEGDSPNSTVKLDTSKIPVMRQFLTLNSKSLSPFFDCKMVDPLEVDHNIEYQKICDKHSKT